MKRHNPMNDYHTFVLYDPEDDVELEVTAYFQIARAEPDVGIPDKWAEIDYFTTETPWGELVIKLEDYWYERADDEVQCAAFEQ